MTDEVKLLPCEAIQQLTEHQQQLDMDGVMVGVSRQALDEVLAYIEATRPTVVTGERELSCERVTLNDRIKQLRAERKSYFDCEGDGVDVLLIDIQDHFDRAAAQKDLSA